MDDPVTCPYGEWRSPIGADVVAGGTLRLAEPRLAGGWALWLETRPAEGGRTVLVGAERDGSVTDLLPEPYSARSRVHEYGGGAYAASSDRIWFVNDADQDIYILTPGEAPTRLTADPARRFADLAPVPGGDRLVCVAERSVADAEPVAELVSVDPAGTVTVLVSGRDFYASPRPSPAGDELAWLEWDHPNMPWDGTELRLAPLRAGTPGPARLIAGSASESIFQPEFDAGGRLYFASDISDWWNLYRWNREEIESVMPMRAEFGLPQWQFGMRTYAVLGDGELLCAYTRDGFWELGLIQPGATLEEDQLVPAGPGGDAFQGVHAAAGEAIVITASVTSVPAVVRFEPGGGQQVLRRAAVLDLPDEALSRPEPVSFASDGETAHALYYPPANAEYRAPPEERPPLLVKCHGGPTGATSPALDPGVQYWTSRGFGVLDVNYRGSTGYGRGYREALYGQWGVVDVADCINGARHLAEAGRVDPQRMAIRGSSAGGYTVLGALCFHDAFRAGASYYGVSDLESLARDTHKFESRYLDALVGPWPDAAATYRRHSPIRHAEGLSCPVIFFQGTEDRVVPPDQAQKMVAALRSRGLPVAYIEFDGEAHGFRRAETVVSCLEAELSFYGRVFGFTPALAGEPVAVENL